VTDTAQDDSPETKVINDKMEKRVKPNSWFLRMYDKFFTWTLTILAFIGMFVILAAPSLAIFFIWVTKDRMAVIMLPVWIIGLVLLVPWLVVEQHKVVLLAAKLANRAAVSNEPMVVGIAEKLDETLSEMSQEARKLIEG